MDTIKTFINNRPQISSWIFLSVGMVIILVWSAWDVGFEPQQWTALIITTILLAGVCVWIIGWEDDEDEWDDEPTKDETKKSAEPSTEQA